MKRKIDFDSWRTWQIALVLLALLTVPLFVYGYWLKISSSFSVNLLLILSLMYAFKAVILWKVTVLKKHYYYWMLVIAVLPWMYLELVDWNHPSISLTAKVMGTPIAFLPIPTISHYYDVSSGKEWSVAMTIVRWLLEVLVVTPLWLIMCLVGELGLGWVSI